MNILKNKNNYLFWAFLILPAFFVFKNLFSGNVLFGGDAPYFYSDTLKQLFSEPLVWTQRGFSFGGINLSLWLSPVMLVYGILGKFMSLGNDTIIKILFLFPSLILSFIGPHLLTKYLKLKKIVGFFASLVYVFNTYFVLLIDGGQVGVALAYGLFPIALLFLKKFVDKKNKNNFLIALISSFLLCTIDPRIALICFLTITIWSILEKKFTYWLLLMGLLLIPLNSYWLYPLMKLGVGGINTSVSNLGLLSLLNPLLLFSPHWPNNIFGKISYPPFYFALIPILIFGSFLKNKNKQNLTYAIILLIFAFLTKGSTPPFGIDLGIVFRDSSKFFIPVILFAGILIGKTMSRLRGFRLQVLGYVFLLMLIIPALFGKMNFLLSNHNVDESYQKIAQTLSSQNEEFRTIWFTRKNPLSYESEKNSAIDAIELTTFWPFAQMNGSEDVFNFVNNAKFVDWFRILGVKYVFLNGDARNIKPSETDTKNWNTINELFEKTKNLKRLEWDLSFPAYEISNPYPKFYAVDKLIAVVGSQRDIYEKEIVPTLYFEDGKWDPSIILDNDPDSIDIYFSDSESLDLTMSLVQKYFVSPSKNKNSQWSVFNSNDYLKYKYQLLIRGYEFSDFDYGRGIALSSTGGESIEFKFNVPQSGDYVLAKRISDSSSKNFKWQIEEKSLEKGKHEYTVTNESDLMILNVVALIPKKDYQEALTLTDELLGKFETVDVINGTDAIEEVDVASIGTSNYSVKSKVKGYWIIYSDNFDPLWKLKNSVNYYPSVPVYSMLNAFYVNPTWGGITIEFTGHKAFRWGVWGSVITILTLTTYFLYQKEKR